MWSILRGQMRRVPWLLLVILAVGVVIAYGGFSTYQDQHSGTPGTAKVSECTGGGKYDRAIRCRGTWDHAERLVVGRVEGAGYGDVGKTIEVRIHGSDHATKPALGTSIMLWAIGGGIALLALWGLWAQVRRPREPTTYEVPPGIRGHLVEVIRVRWSGKDPEPVIASLPDAMPPGTVQRLVSGGPYGWMLTARLDKLGSRFALEVLEDSRMAGPDHYRVWDDGTVEPLASERTGYSLPKGYTPEDEERIKAEWAEHNGRVQQQLRQRGFP